MKTINGVPLSEVTREEAVSFVEKNKQKYINLTNQVDGYRRYNLLINNLRSGRVSSSEIPINDSTFLENKKRIYSYTNLYSSKETFNFFNSGTI